jgi:hypothetical protein
MSRGKIDGGSGMGKLILTVLEGGTHSIQGFLDRRIGEANQDKTQLTPFPRIDLHFDGQRLNAPEGSGMGGS